MTKKETEEIKIHFNIFNKCMKFFNISKLAVRNLLINEVNEV